jgi:anti-sigma regulatory factor (Ser/Thr protein kinase)/CheY-like chemotaxis protein
MDANRDRGEASVARILLVDPDENLWAALCASPLLREREVTRAAGNVDALRHLRARAHDVLITSPVTSVEEDLAFIDEARQARPGLQSIVLAARAAPEEVIAALRTAVFALFTPPFDAEELASMVSNAMERRDTHGAIEVLSARPDWVAVRINCARLTAERLLRFLSELRSEVPAADREGLMLALREVLLNAMKHGAALDPEQVVEVVAVRTERAIVFYVKDPGSGFDVTRLTRAVPSRGAEGPLEDIVRHAELGLRPPGGFGLLLVRAIVNEVIYSEHGNEVLLIKHTR